jgi:hypothetical protein
MDHAQHGPSLERRRLADRRACPMTVVRAFRRKGRRKSSRPARKGYQASVESLERRTIVLALFVFVASLLDALLTLGHLARGGEEANPLLALALTHSTDLFLQLKIGLTGACVGILAAHQHFPLAARGLYGLALGYATLLAYHFLLYVCLV